MKFKLIIFLLILAGTLSAVEYPKPNGWINDYASVLSEETKVLLTDLVTELKQKTDTEVAVAILPDLGGEDYFNYAVELFKQWKVGSKNDEGVLILVAVQERKVKIEVGYGAEGYLTDAISGDVLDTYVVPFLKLNDYDTGVRNAVGAVAQIIAKEKNVQLTGSTGVRKAQRSGKNTKGSWVFIVILLFLIIVTRGRIIPWLFIMGMSGGRSSNNDGGGFDGFGGFGGFGGGSSGGGGAGRGF